MYRITNISKREWVLQYDSVLYGDYPDIEPELEKAMDNEANFNYNGLSDDEIIRKLNEYIQVDSIWQSQGITPPFPYRRNRVQTINPRHSTIPLTGSPFSFGPFFNTSLSRCDNNCCSRKYLVA